MSAIPGTEADPLEGIVIPPKPQILVDLQSVGGDVDKAVELIEQDIGISSSVLKLVNSPYYALSTSVTSIKKAVILMGIENIKSIVRGLTLRASMSESMQAKLREFWDSSMDVAKAASCIAGQTKVCTRDEAYTLGLFHNCGIPILMQKFPEYDEIIRMGYADKSAGIVKLERQAVRIDHAYIGYKLCKLWNLDSNLCRVIMHHHDGKKFFKTEKLADEVKFMGAVLMFAEHCAEVFKTLGCQEEDYAWMHVGSAVMDQLGITEEGYQNIKEHVLESAFV